MNSDGIAVSAHSLSSILFICAYLCACFVLCRKLLPRLSKLGKRLAGVMLAAQVLVIVMSQATAATDDFQAWLWSIGNEWTIESVLSSTQFALVGMIALMISWLDSTAKPWRRFYLVALALLFLYLGLDEYFAWKNYRVDWADTYLAFGLMFATFTLMVVETSPRRARLWLIVLMLGAVTIASGGIAVDNFVPKICDVDLGFIRFEGCMAFEQLDELLELLGGWIALLALLRRLKEVMPVESARIRRLLYVAPALWILLLVQSDAIHPLRIQVEVEPAAVEFESGVALKGYRTKLGSNNLTVNLYVSSRDWGFNQLGYSLHLIDQANSESIAGLDNMLNQQREFYMTRGWAPAYRQWAQIPLPTNRPANRALSIVLTIWRREGDNFLRHRIVRSDLHTLDDTQVVLGEVVFPPDAASSGFSIFKNGFVLVAVDMPANARPGEIMPITFAWASDKDASADHSQFLHLRHETTGEWWVYDQQPLGPRLPTRLWYSGLSDSETWRVPLPADLALGRYEVYTGLYRLRDQERIPAAAADGQPWPDARVNLGDLTIGS